MISEVSEFKAGSVFLYKSSKLEELTGEFIQSIKIQNVQNLLISIYNQINTYEKAHYTQNTKEIKCVEEINTLKDITYKCVNISHWRRGFGFVFLQLSMKDEGQIRVISLVTNTIHHKGGSFSTEPNIKHAKKILKEYMNNKTQVLVDIESLMEHHSTEKTSDELLETIKQL